MSLSAMDWEKNNKVPNGCSKYEPFKDGIFYFLEKKKSRRYILKWIMDTEDGEYFSKLGEEKALNGLYSYINREKKGMKKEPENSSFDVIEEHSESTNGDEQGEYRHGSVSSIKDIDVPVVETSIEKFKREIREREEEAHKVKEERKERLKTQEENEFLKTSKENHE